MAERIICYCKWDPDTKIKTEGSRCMAPAGGDDFVCSHCMAIMPKTSWSNTPEKWRKAIKDGMMENGVEFTRESIRTHLFRYINQKDSARSIGWGVRTFSGCC